MTEMFLSATDVERLCGMGTGGVRNQQLIGTMIDPDVIVGLSANRPTYGWSKGRASAWGVYSGWLYPDGTVRGRDNGDPVVDVSGDLPDWWRVKTRHYLALVDVAKELGRTLQAVRMRSAKGTLPTPAVQVTGGARYPRSGWTRESISAFARREGIRPVTPVVIEDVPALVTRYESGESAESIAKTLGVDAKTVLTRLVKSGVSVRSSKEAARIRVKQG